MVTKKGIMIQQDKVNPELFQLQQNPKHNSQITTTHKNEDFYNTKSIKYNNKKYRTTQKEQTPPRTNIKRHHNSRNKNKPNKFNQPTKTLKKNALLIYN